MKNRITRFIATLLLASFILAFLDSCGMGRWRRYEYRGHYVHKKKYSKMHKHRNRDW